MLDELDVVPVILCGGAGLRLWPLSRRERPKQLLPLGGETTLLEQALARCAGWSAPLLVGAEEQRFLLAEVARRRAPAARILCEPAGRDTAPAVAAAAHEALRDDADPLLLLLPADHVVRDVEAFRRAVHVGARAARRGHIVAFGVRPDHAHTGFGWIDPADRAAAWSTVRAFHEKPDAERARELFAAGWLWNAGLFLARASVLQASLQLHAPAIAAAAAAAVAAAERSAPFVRLEPEAWSGAPRLAFDVAVMERTDRAAVVPVDMGWSDLGSFDALRVQAGGEPVGDVVSDDCLGCHLHADGTLLVASGLRDVVLVATPDAVLAVPRADEARIKRLVAGLGDRVEVQRHLRAERPWGDYRVLDRGDGFQVKCIGVAPGAQLSLQRHQHRAEHWIVVEGAGRVRVDDSWRRVEVGDHVRIPPGSAHRLVNDRQQRLQLIEVQLGGYLGEDDIERLEDLYGRDDVA